MATKKKIRKHQGINQNTGRPKKGWYFKKGGALVKAKTKKK